MLQINPDKIKLNFPLHVTLAVDNCWRSVSQMLIWNVYNFKMSELVRSRVEYNQRAVIIEALRAGCSPTEIIRFFSDIRDRPFTTSRKSMQMRRSPKKVLLTQRGRVWIRFQRKDCKDTGCHPKCYARHALSAMHNRIAEITRKL